MDPEELLNKIYEDYDFAIANLKESYSSNELKRATKGAALAMKARIALYIGGLSHRTECCAGLYRFKCIQFASGLFGVVFIQNQAISGIDFFITAIDYFGGGTWRSTKLRPPEQWWLGGEKHLPGICFTPTIVPMGCRWMSRHSLIRKILF